MEKDYSWKNDAAPLLKETERIDELGRKGYRIVQDTETFCFGIDAVLLAEFAAVKPGDRVVDLGCGNGILPLLLAGRDKGHSFVGVEIQEGMARLAERNVALNGLEKRISILQEDIKNAANRLPRASFDGVVTNPPYIRAGAGLINPSSARALARHELACTLADVLRTAAALLKPGGALFMVYRPDRLEELLSHLSGFGLAAKRLRLVHSFQDSEGILLLLEARRGGAPGLKLLPPLILYDSPGRYSREVKAYYPEITEGAES